MKNTVLSCLALLYFMFSPTALANTPKNPETISYAIQKQLTPKQILQRLQQGNQRFTLGNLQHRNLISTRKTTAVSQYPLAVILNCMDSRTPPEVVFDQGLGDIFAIRIGGNIQNPDILGSLEFGTLLMGAKVIAVIGHSNCGAIRGACQKADLGNLTGLLKKIQPAIQKVAKENPSQACSNNAYIDQIAKENVRLVIKQIKEQSPIIAKLLRENKIMIVGGMQDLATGKVIFFHEG